MIGAGLAYAWVDFVNKLLANDISKGDWVLAVVWLVLTVAFGALARQSPTTGSDDTSLIRWSRAAAGHGQPSPP